jgi:hypothetical protein
MFLHSGGGGVTFIVLWLHDKIKRITIVIIFSQYIRFQNKNLYTHAKRTS